MMATVPVRRATKMVINISHPDQEARVWRGAALIYATGGFGPKCGICLERMDKAARRGFKWHDTALKNEAVKAEVEKLLGGT